MIDPDDDYDGDPWADEYDEEDEFECGYAPMLGSCTLGGTEDCDFECPYRDAIESGEMFNKEPTDDTC